MELRKHDCCRYEVNMGNFQQPQRSHKSRASLPLVLSATLALLLFTLISGQANAHHHSDLPTISHTNLTPLTKVNNS
ncbi:hypothetical protein ACFOEE_08725 [Pseudoalteromonas fenneropenaei]|uniref:Uncharacterized protein n=1 Tax=Pseudoalteromonas fenneropenaei TaxID=1737459 RepID=A0ABV7CJ58_9GAMM